MANILGSAAGTLITGFVLMDLMSAASISLVLVELGDVDLGAFVDEWRVGPALGFDAPEAHTVRRTVLFPTPVERISLFSLQFVGLLQMNVWRPREAYSAPTFGR